MPRHSYDPRPVLAGIAVTAAASLAVYAFLIEPTAIEVNHFDLPISDLPDAWDGKRVVHLSDLHYGDPRSEWLFDRVVETVNDLHPDLILMTGDYVMDHEREVMPALRHLSRLKAEHGLVGVLGDHDFFERTRQIIPGIEEGLRNIGVRLLRNAAVTLPGGLLIAGTDPTTNRVQQALLATALAAAEELGGGLPHVLLSHSPDMIIEASARGVGLQLSGHTHGGQVVVPGYGPPITHSDTGREHASGWSQRGATRLFTSRGIASHWSVRFLCRPEIVVFKLVRA